MDRTASYFIGKAYVFKPVHIYLDRASVTKRMDRVRGVAVHNVHETMKICTSHWPKGLRSKSRQRATSMAFHAGTSLARDLF